VAGSLYIKTKKSWWKKRELWTSLGTITLATVGLVALYISRDTEKRELRAYVFPKAEKLIEYDGTLPYTVHIPIINSGLTPAYDVNISCRMHVAPNPLPESFDLREGPQNCHSLIGVVEVGTDTNHEVELTLKGDSAGLLKMLPVHPELSLYILGRIDYKDVFGQSDFSEYCYSYSTNGRGHLKIGACPGRTMDHN